jgi:excisionase family DNA binding protein
MARRARSKKTLIASSLLGDLISLTEAAEHYGLSSDYLRQLAIRGRLNARKIGRNWVTTLSDVENFIKTREKRGAYRPDLES